MSDPVSRNHFNVNLYVDTALKCRFVAFARTTVKLLSDCPVTDRLPSSTTVSVN